MTRGNQRDLARAKADKKKAEANKGKREPGGPSLIQRREADAAALQAKIAAKAAAKEGGGTNAGGSSTAKK